MVHAAELCRAGVLVHLFVIARGFIRSLHGKWFEIPPERFDALHYLMMGVYKLAIILFCLMPYVALHIVR